MPAGWKLTSGTFKEGQIKEEYFWTLFNYVFSDSSAKRSTYKFGFIKAILDNLFNIERCNDSLFISYENLLSKFAENYWNLVVRYHLRQMRADGKSEYSRIEQIFISSIKDSPSFSNIQFSSIPLEKRKSIIKQVTTDCKKNVIGALYQDFQACLYSFDLKGEGIYLNPCALDFMLKYKIEIEKLNYYAWAKFLEKINDETVVIKLLEKLELSTPQRDNLNIFRQVLYQEFEQYNCFYCGKKLHEIHVDHFIPWSFVKEDKLWNFVLACPSCNIRKSNKLPRKEYAKLIQARNNKLIKLNSNFVINEFKSYQNNLVNDMWIYAQSCGFILM